MKLNTSFPRWALFASLALVLCLALIAWKANPPQQGLMSNDKHDTIPEKRNKITRDFDKELRQLDQAGQQMEKSKDKDWNKIQRDVEETIKNIDVEKIRKEVNGQIEKINAQRLHQIEESLSRIDFDKIQEQIDESMVGKKEIKEQLKKARQQVQEALEKQDWKEDLEKARSINKEELDKQLQKMQKDMKKLKEDLKNQKFNFQAQMDKANVEIDKAREEMKGYQEMVYDMEKDGLLNTGEDYSIEYKNGDLFINDKKQLPGITNRYKKYFKKDKITIKKENGDMHIQH